MTMVVFEPEHFSALAQDCATRPANEVPERLEIRDRLLALDDAMPPGRFPETAILGRDLHRHWSAEHRTALWFPHAFNHYRVDEIYLRSGKSRSQIRALAALVPPAVDEPPELGGFPAHGHLAVGLGSETLFCQFVIGPRAWLDFNYMRDRLASGAGANLFAAMLALHQHEYELWWGEARRLSTFASAQDLADFLGRPTAAVAGEDWFVIRKDVQRESGGRLAVSSQDVQGEIEHLFRVFDLAVRRG